MPKKHYFCQYGSHFNNSIRKLSSCIHIPYLVFNGSGVEHGDVIHSDALPNDSLTPPLELKLTVAVGEVQEPDGVLWRKVNSVCVEIEEEGAVDWVAEVADVNTTLHTILLPVILNTEGR